MKKFLVKYALGGGFGGVEHCDGEILEFENEEKANEYAYDMACEEYDMYDGLHGLRSVDNIMEEDEVDGEEAQLIYEEERETWLDYSVKEVE